ncbi:MAG: FIST N-terminal domain-containing protein [Deltaproteobacteria bacterium]
MKSSAWFADSVEEAESRLRNSLNEGLDPSLAIVFACDAHDLEALGACFARYNIVVFGSGSSGEILNEEFREGSIVVMLWEIDREAYRVRLFDGTGKTYDELGRRIAEWAGGAFPNPGIIVTVGGALADGDLIVKGIVETMGRQIPLFGGLAGNIRNTLETVVFDSSRIVPDGACALVLDTDVMEMRGVAASGWMGIGTVKTVSKSKGNVVYEIDSEPVHAVYNKYLGVEDDLTVAIEYPLLLLRGNDSYVVRAAWIINEDGSMVYSGSVPQGSKVRFSIPPGLEIVDYSIEQISKVIQPEYRPDAILLFSCKARHHALGPLIENELIAIRDRWPAPMVGFFTFGEIGPHPDGQCDFHGTAIVPVLIREKSAV